MDPLDPEDGHSESDDRSVRLQSPSLGPVVVQLFRTARKRNACVWGLSQAVEDFTGTPDKPNEFGGAILTTTATKLIGRQKGNIAVLRQFVHLNETAIHRVKHLGTTEKGKKSEFLLVIGERSETTHSLHIVATPIEYWLLTTFPREKWYRQYWLLKNANLTATEAYERLAMVYPNGLAALDAQRWGRSSISMASIGFSIWEAGIMGRVSLCPVTSSRARRSFLEGHQFPSCCPCPHAPKGTNLLPRPHPKLQ